MKNCNCLYEIPRDGSGQLGRYLKALDPAYAPIDGRSIEDLLVFAKRYAAQIRFYDIPESKIDDNVAPEHISWREFFRRDMAVITASIAVIDIEQLKRDYDQNCEHLEAHPDGDAFSDLFDPILGMVAQIDRWYALAIPANPLHADLELAIQSNLREQVKKIVAYELGFKQFDSKHPLRLNYSAIDNQSLWGLDETIDPDLSIYQGKTLEDQIRNAALFVDDIFLAFHGFITDLVKVKSVHYMKVALEAYPSHQPHMALFIAFLELFRHAQEQMNGLTQRVLDFYYQDVLHLTPKPSIPDRVHVVFELAKDVAQYDLAQGTALKAGKDAWGTEQIYGTAKDLVINQAKVKELKTIFIQKDENAQTLDAIFARPVANSQDGFGEKIEDPSGKWPTFGKGKPKLPDDPKNKNICQQIDQLKEEVSRKDEAQIGIALASPQLLLQGGNRLVIWEIEALPNLLNDNPNIEIWLTGEKGWLKVTKSPLVDRGDFIPICAMMNGSGVFPTPILGSTAGYWIEEKCIFLLLPVAESAIVPFDAKLHPGYPFKTPYPVAQIRFGSALGFNFAAYKSTGLNNQKLAVKVGSILPTNEAKTNLQDQFLRLGLNLYDLRCDGLKMLVLQNETGLLSANKPFDPFTLYPGPGKSFYVGSSEVFNKPLSKLAIDIKKTQEQELDSSSASRATAGEDGSSEQSVNEYRVSVLANKSWLQLSSETGEQEFTPESLRQNILYQIPKTNGNGTAVSLTLPRTPILPVTEFKLDTVKGFISITNLVDPTSVNSYIFHVTEMVPASSNNITVMQASQDLAPKLQIKEISVSYSSELTKLDPAIEQFFHVYPFGVAEVSIPAKKAITSWLVLGPIFNQSNQSGPHEEADKHPKAIAIIEDIDDQIDPKQITSSLQDAPKIGDTQSYGDDSSIFQQYDYTWRVMSFAHFDAGDISTIEDDIHKNLVADDASGVIQSDRDFPGKHHALAFFLVYIISPDARTTNLCVRWDDSIRVWVNGREINELKFRGEHDISSQNDDEKCSQINLKEGCNILLAAVAETHVEWGFSACLTNADGLFISPERPSQTQNLLEMLDKEKDSLVVDARDCLLPQFTYLSSNAAYQSANSSFRNAGSGANSADREALMNSLIYEVSGLRQKITGGNNQYSGDLQEEGMLFIGLEKLRPLDTLTLLFQFAEGSAADEDNEPPPIHWSYLTSNEWRPLPAENLVSDKTDGFRVTGIVMIAVPEGITNHNTIITDGLYWFCASVTEHSDRIPMLVNVIAQAVEARFQDNGNAPSHFDKAMPAGSIAKLAVAVAEVGEVEQPFASFDGKHQELGKEFYTRVSERLRHKGRAITSWDYEHLVLDRFPSIYKVKCIPHTDPECLCRVRKNEKPEQQACCGPQVAPGHVLIVPIANLKNRNAANPLQPKTSRRTLLDIEDYLSKRTSPFVRVHAKNPLYEQILVYFKVQFKPGEDKGYHLRKLNDEIVQYLTPWVFDEDADVSFAQKIYASAIINFIEERSYVDFITDFLMFVCRDECCPPVETSAANVAVAESKNVADMLASISGCCDLEALIANQGNFVGEIIAEPSTPRSILVSAPKHLIIPYDPLPESMPRTVKAGSRGGVKSAPSLDVMEKVTERVDAAPSVKGAAKRASRSATKKTRNAPDQPAN